MARASTRGGSAEGRLPPPAETRFLKGTSGNPRGRPKGLVSLEAITRKFALRQRTISIGGKPQRLSALAITLQVLKAQAVDGKPTATRLINELRVRMSPAEPELDGKLLLVPAPLSMEEYSARVEEQNKQAVEPGTAINLETEEFLKAVRGEPTELGQALLARHRKYHGN